ncbi:FadR/GntR family transcriptional regulator [Actinomadura keratinilytica]
MALGSYNLHDVLEARVVLERSSFEAAATHASAEDLAEAEETLRRMQEPDVTVPEFNDLDTSFHVQIARSSGNQLTSTLTSAVRESVRPSSSRPSKPPRTGPPPPPPSTPNTPPSSPSSNKATAPPPQTSPNNTSEASTAPWSRTPQTDPVANSQPAPPIPSRNRQPPARIGNLRPHRQPPARASNLQPGRRLRPSVTVRSHVRSRSPQPPTNSARLALEAKTSPAGA